MNLPTIIEETKVKEIPQEDFYIDYNKLAQLHEYMNWVLKEYKEVEGL